MKNVQYYTFFTQTFFLAQLIFNGFLYYNCGMFSISTKQIWLIREAFLIFKTFIVSYTSLKLYLYWMVNGFSFSYLRHFIFSQFTRSFYFLLTDSIKIWGHKSQYILARLLRMVSFSKWNETFKNHLVIGTINRRKLLPVFYGTMHRIAFHRFKKRADTCKFLLWPPHVSEKKDISVTLDGSCLRYHMRQLPISQLPRFPFISVQAKQNPLFGFGPS
jgi:uncharacterized protein YbcV (DUF1398 family)